MNINIHNVIKIDELTPVLLPPEKKKNGRYYRDQAGLAIGYVTHIDVGSHGIVFAWLPEEIDEYGITDDDLKERTENFPEDEVLFMDITGSVVGYSSGTMVLTTRDAKYGSGMVLTNAGRQKINERFPEGAYLLPSSIHEWIAVSVNSYNIRDVQNVVRETNENMVIPSGDFLSNDIYCYSSGGELMKVPDDTTEFDGVGDLL